MLASKAGSKKTSLQLLFRDDLPSGGLLFTFTSSTRDDDRKEVQDLLIPFVSANKSGKPLPLDSSCRRPIFTPSR